MLRLERPLVWLDLETTGTDVKTDRIVQIALIRMEPEVVIGFGDGWKVTESYSALVNPGIPIPAAATDVHGITDDMVQGAGNLFEHLARITHLIKDADLAGYNAAAFDVPLLQAEYERWNMLWRGPVDRVILDPLILFRKEEPRTLEKAVEFYLGREHEDAHDAMYDIRETINVFRAQLERYDMYGTPAELAAKIRHPYLDSQRRFLEKDGDVIIDFGKHKGMRLQDVPRGYLDWMCREMGTEASEIIESYQKQSVNV